MRTRTWLVETGRVRDRNKSDAEPRTRAAAFPEPLLEGISEGAFSILCFDTGPHLDLGSPAILLSGAYSANLPPNETQLLLETYYLSVIRRRFVNRDTSLIHDGQ